MSEYGDIGVAFAGMFNGIQANRKIQGAWKAKEEIAFGDAVFTYAGDDNDAYRIARDVSQIVLSGDLVSLNVITTTITIDGVAQAAVATTFATDHDTTMAAHVAAIEAAISGISATLTDTGGDNRTIKLLQKGKDINLVTSVVTLGAGQATATITYTTDQIFVGFAGYTARQSLVESSEEGRYNEGDSVNVLIDGQIYVNCSKAVSAYSKAYLIYDPSSADQGELTDSSSGTYNLNCYFQKSLAAAGLALVEVNELYDGPA